MVTEEQKRFFQENGYLRLEQVFSPAEVEQLREELDYIIYNFADWNSAWRGEWRKEYVDDPQLVESVKLVAIHELQHYSAAWTRAITHPGLAEAIAYLIDADCLEFHHCTLHAKPPGEGAPFPLHQDLPFYPHEDGLQYVDALVHLDDADEETGCIKFLKGSHKLGALEHIIGPETAPHLPTDQYRLEDAVSVPAKAGDVVLFYLWTIHGSAVNKSNRWRRIVRVGYRDPRNRQTAGQAMGRPGIIVKGVRPKVEGIEINVYGNWTPQPAQA
ncbi:MAG: phytanoyl-CoA dioxygenase family protein [Armatimonadetes bacterium]|nr:phytanoyl-CoA dioxygenase family protein [Armatimonadota bacterium]MDW8121375.1 phytanoyl-CoA dioxygenase family protein [Armatimonadota bacterium]